METINDRDIKRAALILAAGYQVKTVKIQCSPRCSFQYDDLPAIRSLVEAYETKQVVPVPHKKLMNCFGALLSEVKSLQAGRIGGGV